MSTKLDLDAIEARANAATPGPWCYDSVAMPLRYRRKNTLWMGCDDLDDGCPLAHPDDGDATFMVNARTDIPDLIARVRELEAENANLLARIDNYDGLGPIIPGDYDGT